jgi:hypothetical protein
MGFFGGSSVDLTSPGPIGSTTPNTGRFTTLTLAPSANTTPFTASGYSLTGTNAQSLFDLSGTWNTTGTPTAFKLNVTDTASNASSLLMDLQVGGTSQFFVSKSGGITLFNNSASVTIGTVAGSQVGILRSGGALNLFLGNSTSVMSYNGSNATLPSSSVFGWSSGALGSGTFDLNLARDASDTLAQRRSTNAQAFKLYRTFTDASNYERLGFLATNTTRYTITSENAGTGSARSLEVSFYTSSADPTSTNITSGCFSVWKNSGTGTIKLWANDGGTMKSVALA